MADHEEALRAQRLDKLDALRRRGIDPYPPRFAVSHQAAAAIAAFEAAETANADAPTASVAGRITAMRVMGKASFLDLRDGSGRIQLHLRRDVLGDDYSLVDELDLGDFVGASGTLFRTRTGEVTVAAESLVVLTKALKPPPEKWHGLQDIELRYRRRYLDLMANDEVRRIFRARSGIVSSIRRFMEGRGFIEVETPVLQAAAGGAAAKPFVTYHNALDRELYLRIATELHLKRLIVGGLDRVYEVGRVFRNEGVSWKYNPEFTMLESYEAYADYGAVAEMLEQMISTAAREVLGTTKVRWKDQDLDVAPSWQRATYRDLVLRYAELDLDDYMDCDLDVLRSKMRELGVEPDPHVGRGKLFDEIFSRFVEPHLSGPIIVNDYPLALSPLAKKKAGAPGYVERFEAFLGGFEIGNAYTELNDPVDQRRRFEEQLRLRAAGDEEAELMDEDFLLALEHGMPPTGGLGVGIDRLLMVLLGVESIREVILFPQLRTVAET